MVELYSDLSNGQWRIVMEQNGSRGRVEYSRTEMTTDWHLAADGTILLEYPDGFEGFVPKYVLAKIAAMCKVAYAWHSLKRSGVDYGPFALSDEYIDGLIEGGVLQVSAEQAAEVKRNKDQVMERAVDAVMELYWIDALQEAIEELLYEEVSA